MTSSRLFLLMIGVLVVGLCLTCPPAAAADSRKIVPVDEARRDPALVDYRARLIEIAKIRDVDRLAEQVAPNIKLGFGGAAGPDDLRVMLTGEQGEEIWQALLRVLENGGSFDGFGHFAAPYWSYAEFGPDADPFSSYVVTGTNVPVFDIPDETSDALLHLSHDVVTAIEDDGRSAFVHVQMADERKVHVARNKLGSTVGYRSLFKKTAKGWRMIMFLAGD